MDGGVSQGLTQTESMRQEQTLTPQQLQSLEVLAAPVLELREKIDRELVRNPILEADSPDFELPPPSEKTPDREEPGNERDDMEEQLARIVDRTAGEGESPEDIVLPESSDFSEEEERRKFLMDSIESETSMQEQLMEQLRYAESDPETLRVAEAVIGGIDESGYLKTHPADIATGAECSLEQAEKAIRLVQTFDPPGIGARSLEECLLLQLERGDNDTAELVELVTHHLEDIAKNRLPELARSMNLSPEQLDDDIKFIKSLNPYPGHAISNSKPVYIVPEVSVERDGDEFKVIPNDNNYLPRLRISKTYLKMLEDPNLDSETRTYIRTKLANGEQFIKSLEQRGSTIVRIAESIVSAQYDFFMKGIEYLKPMTMKQVARKLGIHETTVSRAAANKYMRTPFGLIEFKYFFTTGFQSESGEEISSRGVKEIIRELVDNENSASPLSDSKLEKLLAERGLNVARRTIAKYREEMGIQPSHLRRTFP